jgi:hypothetical protein
VDKENLTKVLTSKKFWASVVGLGVALGFLKSGEEAALAEALVTVATTASYVIGQGIADNGKEIG